MTDAEAERSLTEHILSLLLEGEDGKIIVPEPTIAFVMNVLDLTFEFERDQAEATYSEVATLAAALGAQGHDGAADTLTLILLQAEPLAEAAGLNARDLIEKAKSNTAAALLGRDVALRAPKVGEKAPPGTFKVGSMPPGGRRL